jgi:hypothetical protein
MRRILLVLAVAAFMAVMLAVSAGSAFADADPDNSGNTANAPGQANARENCYDNITKQDDRGVEAGGGPKSDTGSYYASPTNCDHYW